MSDETVKELSQFLKDRNEALLSGDVEKVREFVKKHGIGGDMDLTDEGLRIAMHRGRIHWRECPPEMVRESVWWLLDNEYSLDMEYWGTN